MKYVLEGHTSKRLRFALLTRDYFDEWVTLFEKPDVAKYLTLDETLSPTELAESWFSKSLTRYDENRGGMNVLLNKETGAFIGQCGLLIQDIEGTLRMEIGYSILPKYWGQGYATEAAIAVKNAAIEKGYPADFGNTLISVVHVDNVASSTVAKRNGMTLEKHYPAYHGIPVDLFSLKVE